jgi:uncharacterized protein YbaP (TraB family)
MIKDRTLFRLQLCPFALMVLCLAFLFLPLSALSQKPQQTRSMMWQIKSGKNTAYVLGSLHAVTRNFYPFPKEIDDAFEKSDKLLVEVDMTKPRSSAGETPGISGSAIFENEDDTLWKHLDEKTAERLKIFLVANNIPPERFEIMKPVYVAFEIDRMSNAKSNTQSQITFGIDLYFMIRALGKKQIVELESYNSQQQILYNQPVDVQARYLKATLDRVETKRDYFAEMLEHWLKGDEEQIDRIFTEIHSEPAEMQRPLREGRNPKMAEAVENCLKNGERCFMIVGAAHVVGKEGIVSLLKNKGYQTKQIMVTTKTNANSNRSNQKK